MTLSKRLETLRGSLETSGERYLNSRSKSAADNVDSGDECDPFQARSSEMLSSKSRHLEDGVLHSYLLLMFRTSRRSRCVLKAANRVRLTGEGRRRVKIQVLQRTNLESVAFCPRKILP